MFEFLRSLDAGTWIGIVFGIAGTVGTILTIALRERRGLAYCVIENTIIDRVPQLLQRVVILYDTRAVTSVAVTKLAVWNSGNKIIRKSDLDTADPVRLSPADGVEILEASILAGTNSNSKADLQEQEDGSNVLKLEYLNPKDGLIVQVIHTAGEKQGISIDGSAQGITHVRQKQTRGHDQENATFHMDRRTIRSKIVLYLLFAVMVGYMTTSIVGDRNFIGYFVLLGIWGLLLFGVATNFSRVPRELRKLA